MDTPRPRTDDLCRTPDERAALAALRDVTGDPGGPMERHAVRCFLLAERLLERLGADFDRELLLVAALLHDAGLYPGASQGGVYVTDGRRFAERLLSERGWQGTRLERCLDAIEHHHELGEQWERGAEVEALRRADLIELSAGALRLGLPRADIRSVFLAVPRSGIWRELGRMVGRAALERPRTLPRIFSPGG